MSKTSPRSGESVTLGIENQRGAKVTATTWDFGDNGKSSENPASHTWTVGQKTTFWVKADVTLDDGQQKQHAFQVTVDIADKVDLTIQLEGTGSVTGQGINCTSTCTVPVPPNKSITLTAKASGQTKVGTWTGCSSASAATCTVNVGSTTATVKHTFLAAAQKATIKVRPPDDDGNITLRTTTDNRKCPGDCEITVNVNTKVSIEYDHGTFSAFKNWNGVCASQKNAICEYTPTKADTVETWVTDKQVWRLYIDVVNTMGAQGKVTGPGIPACMGHCIIEYDPSNIYPRVKLTAAPITAGTVLTNWSGAPCLNPSQNPPTVCDLEIPRDVHIKATFGRIG
jgi:hypothetical protein